MEYSAEGVIVGAGACVSLVPDGIKFVGVKPALLSRVSLKVNPGVALDFGLPLRLENASWGAEGVAQDPMNIRDTIIEITDFFTNSPRGVFLMDDASLSE